MPVTTLTAQHVLPYLFAVEGREFSYRRLRNYHDSCSPRWRTDLAGHLEVNFGPVMGVESVRSHWAAILALREASGAAQSSQGCPAYLQAVQMQA